MARVTLTIDNGPDPDVTPRLLDVLKRRGVRASFFVLGRSLADPALRRIAERARDEGHWIGNHTWSHAVPFGENDDPLAVTSEVVRTEALIGDLAHPDRFFRPFGGGGHLDARLLSRDLVAHLTERAYTCVLWNAVPRDWEQPEAWVDTALAQVAALDRAVVVVHDVVPRNDASIDRFLGALGDAGHELVQGFPPDCTPIVRGEIRAPLDAFVGR